MCDPGDTTLKMVQEHHAMKETLELIRDYCTQLICPPPSPKTILKIIKHRHPEISKSDNGKED